MKFTLYQQHKKKWSECTDCLLCEGRTKVVIAKGTIPCDILFIGEAAGVSEDIIGKPFVGPAGKLLHNIIDQTLGPINEQLEVPLTIAFTNLVCCIPLDEGGDKVSEPPDEAIRACQPRLKEFIRIAKPKLLIAVGDLADSYLSPDYRFAIKHKLPWEKIKHPAAILRSNWSQQGLEVQKCRMRLRDAIERHLLNSELNNNE